MADLTSREKKEWLRRYRYALREADRLQGEIERWRAVAERVTPSLHQAPSGGGDGRSLERAVEQITRLESDLAAQLSEAVAVRYEVERAVAGLDDLRLRELLRLRYIEGRTWEEIARVMGYSDIRWVYRLHGGALEQLTIESHV